MMRVLITAIDEVLIERRGKGIDVKVIVDSCHIICQLDTRLLPRYIFGMSGVDRCRCRCVDPRA